jgi:hypothetical protein
MQREGELAREQIQEVVMSRIVAPSEGLADMPEPMPEELKLDILAWSRNLT